MTALTRSDRDRILAAWDAMVAAWRDTFGTDVDSFERYRLAIEGYVDTTPIQFRGAAQVAYGE